MKPPEEGHAVADGRASQRQAVWAYSGVQPAFDAARARIVNMPYVIVEYEFDPPITDEGLEQMAGAVAACESARQVRRLRTVISADRQRGYCELEAPDAETVREAYRSARIPFRSVWAARLLDFRAPSEG